MTAPTFLLGFPGSGKSYWGARLAERLGRPFIDLDRFIVQQTGWPVERLFGELDEGGFRAVERAALLSLPLAPAMIVACGGGTPCFFNNLDWMQSRGRTVFLDAPPAVLLPRLQRARASRPLLRDLSDAALADWVSERLARRLPWYTRADERVPVSADEAALEARLTAVISINHRVSRS